MNQKLWKYLEFVGRLHGCGISTAHVDVDGTDKIFETWRPIRLAESAAIHKERMVSRRDDYGEDVIRMLEKGLEITAVKYIKPSINGDKKSKMHF